MRAAEMSARFCCACALYDGREAWGSAAAGKALGGGGGGAKFHI
jgi:hypothetical protein